MSLDYYKGILLDIDTELEFGIHQGLSIEEILDDDPSYVEWLIDQGFEASIEVLNRIEN